MRLLRHPSTGALDKIGAAAAEQVAFIDFTDVVTVAERQQYTDSGMLIGMHVCMTAKLCAAAPQRGD